MNNQGDTMNNDLHPAAPAADIPAPASVAGQPRGLHVAALLNLSALPATTALLAAAGPKFPPYVGD
jgi:hypothetical protein